MTVIAFRPRPRPSAGPSLDTSVPLVGTFRSPRGRMGRMAGTLRVHRLVIAPRGAFVTGAFTGELRDVDGSLVGVDSRRLTAAVDLVRSGGGYVPVMRPFTLDLMGIAIELAEARIEPLHALDTGPRTIDPRSRRLASTRAAERS